MHIYEYNRKYIVVDDQIKYGFDGDEKRSGGRGVGTLHLGLAIYHSCNVRFGDLVKVAKLLHFCVYFFCGSEDK